MGCEKKKNFGGGGKKNLKKNCLNITCIISWTSDTKFWLWIDSFSLWNAYIPKYHIKSNVVIAALPTNPAVSCCRIDWISDDESVGMTKVRRKRRQRSTSSTSTPSSGIKT